MHVVVTGGAGYLGYDIVGALGRMTAVSAITIYDNASRGQHAVLCGRQTDVPAHFVHADVLDSRRLVEVVADADVVIHLAAIVYDRQHDSDAHRFDQVNHWGTAQVAQAIEQSDRVRHVIYLSSSTVYGVTDDTPADVDRTPEPTNAYAITKLRGEGHLTRLATRDRHVHVLRSGNAFGINPAARYDSVINRFLLDAKFGGRLTVHGHGHQRRSFVHSRRVARAVAGLVDSQPDSATLNMADHDASVLDIVDHMQRLAPELDVVFVDQDMQMTTNVVVPSSSYLELVGAPRPISDILDEEWARLQI